MENGSESSEVFAPVPTGVWMEGWRRALGRAALGGGVGRIGRIGWLVGRPLLGVAVVGGGVTERRRCARLAATTKGSGDRDIRWSILSVMVGVEGLNVRDDETIIVHTGRYESVECIRRANIRGTVQQR